MYKILLTGGNGLLAKTFYDLLHNKYQIYLTNRNNADIRNLDNIINIINYYRPDIVIHCAAMTNVDQCEINKQNAFLTNSNGTMNIALACKQFNVRLFYISTDYVFDGIKGDYIQTDIANGGNTIYGISKFLGQCAVNSIYPENSVICRVAWLYGKYGNSFVQKILNLSNKQNIKVVDDQIGNPTSAFSVAMKIDEIIQHKQLNGIIHLTSENKCSRYQFAKKIFEINNINKQIIPCSTSDFVCQAKRPKNSNLIKFKLKQYNLKPMPTWQQSLKKFFNCYNK